VLAAMTEQDDRRRRFLADREERPEVRNRVRTAGSRAAHHDPPPRRGPHRYVKRSPAAAVVGQLTMSGSGSVAGARELSHECCCFVRTVANAIRMRGS